jgi:hypothetical protein
MPKTPIKSGKQVAQASPSPDLTVESVLDDSISTLALGLAAIRAEIQAIQSGKSKSEKHDAGSRIAFLTAKVGAIADSIRKVEAARTRRIERLTKSQILAWLRSLEESERAAFLREALRIDEEGSVLS